MVQPLHPGVDGRTCGMHDDVGEPEAIRQKLPLATVLSKSNHYLKNDLKGDRVKLPFIALGKIPKLQGASLS